MHPSSSSMRRSKALFPDETDDDERQAVGPHAPGADTSSSDDEDERMPAAMTLSPAPVAELDCAEAVSAAAEAEAVAEATDDVEAAAIYGGDGVDEEVLATASVTESIEVAEVHAIEPVVAEGDSKRKRDDDDDGDEADVEEEKREVGDEDVQPLRLKKAQRSKAAAASSSQDGSESSSGAVSRPPRTEASPSFASPSSMLSPMKDDSKRRHTPRKSRLSKKPQNLQARMGATELTEKQVVKMIAKLYEEQEQDDRDMYDILTQTVKEQTQCELSDVVDELDAMEFRRMLTYGEVSVESVSSTILPLLKLQADDVFYDLGCGSGKIVLQAVLQTPCAVAKGIELMQNRVQKGADALQRLGAMKLPLMEEKNVDIVQGDICKPPEVANMRDATVVFINNVCFGPELMLRVMQMLTLMPKLRRVVTLRKFCVRHRPQKCQRANSLCVDYVHPPEEAEIFVSWASKTSVYLYERVAFSVETLAAQLQIPTIPVPTVAAVEQLSESASTSQESQ